MDKIITYSLGENFIEKLADFINEHFIKKGADISQLAFVFEGKRPALFLKRALSKKTGKSFLSPVFFSIDEFVQYTLSKDTEFTKSDNMESWYLLYTLSKDIAPGILRGKESFSDFLPWAKAISQIIDTIDIEDVPDDALKNVQASASIGYEIPENINEALKNIVALRKAYHQRQAQGNSFSKGFIYLSSAKVVEKAVFNEFAQIFFCGFFYMQKTEKAIIKSLFDRGKAILFFQGDKDNWPVLKDNSEEFPGLIKPQKKSPVDYTLKIYAGFDCHSQVSAVREIVKKTDKLDSTVIILPDSNSMIPLVSELGSSIKDFNVSLGYPLKRSSLYSLFELIVSAQKTKKGGEYYAKDYIALLSHPLVKNLRILSSHSATRILVHKIEEALLGMTDSVISGRLFIGFEQIETERSLLELAARQMDSHPSIAALQKVLKKLHLLLFTLWQDLSNFREFASSLGKLLEALLKDSFMVNYPLNLKIAERMYAIRDELYQATFAEENFLKEDIFKMFRNLINGEMIAFSGSPLKGLQILGMLETRALNFRNVIIMDANESILPKIDIHHPLIPQEVKLNLGLDIIKNEQEIQNYRFKRIISSARKVHLLYRESAEKGKSRFIEELIWQRQKERKKLEVAPVSRVNFSVDVLPAKRKIKKTREILNFLRHLTYSASSINSYLQCPLQFYYKYVLGFKEKAVLPEEPEGKDIGTFIHQLLENAFSGFIEKKPRIDEKFRQYFFEMFTDRFKKTFGKRMRSDSFLLEEVMHFRLERFLDFEENNGKRKVEKILCLEQQFKEKIELSGDTVNFTYIMDRVDKLDDGSILILDYKTGSASRPPQNTVQLEKMELKRESIRDRLRSFQLPLYYYFEKKKYREENLSAALYNLRNLKLTYFPGEKADPQKRMEICLRALDFIIHEIVNPEEPFAADREEENKCKYCPFFYLCR